MFLKTFAAGVPKSRMGMRTRCNPGSRPGHELLRGDGVGSGSGGEPFRARVMVPRSPLARIVIRASMFAPPRGVHAMPLLHILADSCRCCSRWLPGPAALRPRRPPGGGSRKAPPHWPHSSSAVQRFGTPAQGPAPSKRPCRFLQRACQAFQTMRTGIRLTPGREPRRPLSPAPFPGHLRPSGGARP